MTTKLKLKLGYEHAIQLQYLESMSLVVSSIFGGKKAKPKPTKNFAEAQMVLGKIFSKGKK